MKVVIDGICGRTKCRARISRPRLYVREGTAWKGAWHGEANVVDPKAPPTAPVPDNGPVGSKPARVETIRRRPAALAAIEKSVWERLDERDTKKLTELTTPTLPL